MALDIAPAARVDVRGVYQWYIENSSMAEAWLLAFGETLEAIEASPRRFPRPHYYRGRREVRRARMDRFPYVVVFEVRGDGVRVLAVMHTSRRLGAWVGRLTGGGG